MDRPTPLCNRVAPDGRVHAVAERGTMMGNRGGRLHRADGSLGTARWRSRAWIACELAFRGRHRQVMGPGYTELFFLDEAVAVAAGHRPCFECRRGEARAFAAAWAVGLGLGAPPTAGEMDRALHAARLGPPARVVLGALPPGAMFAAAGGLHLRTPGGSLAWSFGGYAPGRRFAAEEEVAALTPAPARAALAAGYLLRLHPSAEPQFSAR